MSHDLLNSVAATTTHRDRDELDRSIARLLLRFLELHSVTVLRLSDEGEIKRIVRCAGSEAAEVDAVCAAGMSTLPALADFPGYFRHHSRRCRPVPCVPAGAQSGSGSAPLDLFGQLREVSVLLNGDLYLAFALGGRSGRALSHG
jgi:hypothetical protein